MTIIDAPLNYLCSTSDVQPGCAKRIDLPDQAPVAVFNIDGRYFVTDDTCTHGEASLADGYIEDDIVECPYHQGTFNIQTGKPIGAPCTRPLKTYIAIVKHGGIHIAGTRSGE